MLVSKRLSLIIPAFIFILASCQEDFIPEPVSKTYPAADQALWDHFSDFEAEALARGINIDLNAVDLTAGISEIDEENVAGLCQYGTHITNNVIIDGDFWNNTSFSSREFVVFHELGHCVLGRGHTELQNSNGSCTSMMASGTGSCRFNYTTQTRATYLDELFLNAD